MLVLSAFQMHGDIFSLWSSTSVLFLRSEIWAILSLEVGDESVVEIDQSTNLFDFLYTLRKLDFPDFIDIFLNPLPENVKPRIVVLESLLTSMRPSTAIQRISQ